MKDKLEYPCTKCKPPKYAHYFGYCDNCEKISKYQEQHEEILNSKYNEFDKE